MYAAGTGMRKHNFLTGGHGYVFQSLVIFFWAPSSWYVQVVMPTYVSEIFNGNALRSIPGKTSDSVLLERYNQQLASSELQF